MVPLWRRILFRAVPVLDDRPPLVDTPFGYSFRRLYDEADWEWNVHGAQARHWTRVHYLFGPATASLAAISGFGGLGDLFSRSTAAWFALAAAVVAALSTSLQADQQRKRHVELAAAWDNLRQDLYSMYASLPGAAERIRYGNDVMFRRHREARSRGQEGDLGVPPDPDGWQTHMERLQARAKVLRRGQLDDDGAPPMSRPDSAKGNTP
jgi:hypothetical protein